MVDTAALFAQYWTNPADTAVLRVWADALIELGDLRGEYIQLCLVDAPTEQQLQRRRQLERRSSGKLVGPAREYLREWRFGPNGLVERARCDGDRLAAGVAEIGGLNPELCLTITQRKHDSIGSQLADVSLEHIYYADFAGHVLGSGTVPEISDKQLALLAPSLRRVRHLSLPCHGYMRQPFTPDGLRALAEHLEALELFVLDYQPSLTSHRIPEIDGYAAVIADMPTFRQLKVLFLRGVDRGWFNTFPALATLETRLRGRAAPINAREIEAMKRSRASRDTNTRPSSPHLVES